MQSGGRTATRVFAAVSGVTGLAMVGGAGRLAPAIAQGGAVPDPRIVQVLGTRQLAQAALTFVVPTAPVLALGAGIDASHAASMFALAGASRRYRRPALLSAAVASAAVVAGALLARRSSR